jgi:hypothetical protein
MVVETITPVAGVFPVLETLITNVAGLPRFISRGFFVVTLISGVAVATLGPFRLAVRLCPFTAEVTIKRVSAGP